MWRLKVRAKAAMRTSVESIWERVSDYEATPSWVKNGPTWVRITRDGEGTKNGLHAVRTVKFPFWPAVTEEIVRFEPKTRFDYSLRSGMPHVGEHLGSVWIEPSGEEQVLHWDIDFGFKPWHPLSWGAPVFVKMFGGIVQRGCDELARQLSP
jgi:hypothetical protein